MTEFKVEIKKQINAGKEKIWDALTNPEIIKQYLFGTEVISDWTVGAEIVFQGEYEDSQYKDKGTIRVFDVGKSFQYTYLSSFSGLEDIPENYHLITYNLDDKNGITMLTIVQENIQSQEARDHSEKNWEMVLNKIKEIVEE